MSNTSPQEVILTISYTAFRHHPVARSTTNVIGRTYDDLRLANMAAQRLAERRCGANEVAICVRGGPYQDQCQIWDVVTRGASTGGSGANGAAATTGLVNHRFQVVDSRYEDMAGATQNADGNGSGGYMGPGPGGSEPAKGTSTHRSWLTGDEGRRGSV